MAWQLAQHTKIFFSMKKTALLLLSCIIYVIATPQKTLTLQECIDIALQNNQQIKDATYQNSINKIALQQSQALRLPNVNINLNQGINTGRSIDPFSNQFIDQTIRFGNYGLGIDFTIFNGLQTTNTIKRNRATMQAGEKEGQSAKNTIALTVIRNFLQVVSNQEIARATELQLAATREQLSAANKKVMAGVLAESQLADLNAQLATELLNLANAKNNIEQARLDLFFTMNYDSRETVVFKSEEPMADSIAAVTDANAIYEAALKFLPDVQNIELKKRSVLFEKSVAKGLRYPTLAFFANAGSTYSSSVNKTQFIPDGTTTSTITTSPDNFISVAGADYYVQQKSLVQNGTTKPFTYFNQLNANINSAVGLALRIPILNGMQAKMRIANADAAIERVDGQLVSIKNQLRNAVEKAVQNLDNANQKIVLTRQQVAALQQTVTNASIKIENGITATLDYVIAKSNYDKAKVTLIQATYEQRFLQIIVQFYQTGSWLLQRL
jgi:outer membrane protein